MGLTDLFIKRQKPPESGQKTYFDTDPKGFGIRISQGGTKTFVYKYGKARKLKTIGRYPDWSLTDARREAKRIQGEVLSLPSATSKLPECTFAEARERFLKDSQARTKPKTHEEYTRLLHKHFAFKKLLVDINRQDIMSAVSELRSKPSVEQHAFVAVRTLMNWCVRHGLLHTSPVPRLRFQTTSRSRVLSDDELQLVWRRAEEVGYPYGTIVQLLMLTGQRRGEIGALRASWVDQEGVNFPSLITKNGREHRIPLGPLTKEIINSVEGEGDLLFPARGKTDTAFSGWSKAKRQFDAPLGLAPWTIHDLRRTYATKLAELGTPIHVTEKLLNHVSGTLSGVAGIYNRHAYWEEMVKAAVRIETTLVTSVADWR